MNKQSLEKQADAQNILKCYSNILGAPVMNCISFRTNMCPRTWFIKKTKHQRQRIKQNKSSNIFYWS